MYLRGLHCQTSNLRKQATLWSVSRSRVALLAYTSQRLEKAEARTEPYSSELKRQRHEDQQERPKRGSIRPLTVFAICIPLGYGLNWALKARDEATTAADKDGFIKYTLANKEAISSTGSIFTLKPATSSSIRTDEASLDRVITSVQFKQPQLQIARNYTLLPPKEGQDSLELSFLIRKERNGEVSGYLHRLPVGSEMELRGLSAEHVLPESVDTVVFLAGGTGIAPAMQVASALKGAARVHILWASRRREDCVGGISDSIKEVGRSGSLLGWWMPYEVPSSGLGKGHVPMKSSDEKSAIVSQLEHLKQRFPASKETTSGSHPRGQLLVDYYVDEEGAFIQPKDVQRLLQLTSPVPPEKDAAGKKILFVSGPEGFVNHWAAPKQWINGREVQGPLGGVLSTLNTHGWEIVKL